MKKLIIGMLLFFALAFVAINHYYSDMTINKYATPKEVKADNAIAHGWVPALLPPSAHEIEETHDPDTGTVVGKFSYAPKDESMLMKQLVPTDANGTLYEWKGFLFKVDTQKHLVRYRNKPVAAAH